MHHKKRRHKKRRAGCLLCKPYKSNGVKNGDEAQTWQERKARISDKEVLTCNYVNTTKQ